LIIVCGIAFTLAAFTTIRHVNLHTASRARPTVRG
jgi:hypothetical protein